MPGQLSPSHQVVHALPGDAEHRSGHRVRHRLGTRMPGSPGHGQAQGRLPPPGRRIERSVTRIQAADQADRGALGDPVIVAQQLFRQPAGLFP
jgi:hypothetical protein